MNIFHALVLGIAQGIAEFFADFFERASCRFAACFRLAGSAAAFRRDFAHSVSFGGDNFFRKKIARLFVILFRWIFRKPASEENENSFADASPESAAFDLLAGTEELGRRTILAVIATTLVTGAIGIFTSKFLPEFPIQAVCVGFLFTAALLIVSGVFSKRKISAEKKSEIEKKSAQGISVFQALVIGAAQGVGTLPGVSRSGSTISGALFCGVPSAQAAEYSFIVSIPAILAAFVLELRDVSKMSAVGALPLAVSCVACFIAAYASLSWLMRIIKKGRLEWFSCYLIPLGILGLIFF